MLKEYRGLQNSLGRGPDEEEKRLYGAGGEGGQKRGQKAVEDLRRWSDEMEVRGQWKEAALWQRGGATWRRMSEGDEWWEKGERGVFERGEREAWREKSGMVALRGRGERGELALKLEKRNG